MLGFKLMHLHLPIVFTFLYFIIYYIFSYFLDLFSYALSGILQPVEYITAILQFLFKAIETPAYCAFFALHLIHYL